MTFRRSFPRAIWFITGIALSPVLSSVALGQNLLPIQISITQQILSTPDPPPPSSDPINVVPFEFDPFGTHLVQATWQTGVGCPTRATTNDGTGPNTFTDPACPTGDARDTANQGLLLAKTGPTANVAAAGARLLGPGVKGVVLTELGYDLRKPGGLGTSDPRGSHCGAGAPRFNIVIADDPGAIYFIGCSSPPPNVDVQGAGWQRLRWGGTSMSLFAFRNGTVPTDISGKTAQSIEIVFDEGQDAGPDFFGLAVLDNIDVNGNLTGRGPTGQ